ncbi:hypothetical protein ACJX0J_030550, partial [Zea mays]
MKTWYAPNTLPYFRAGDMNEQYDVDEPLAGQLGISNKELGKLDMCTSMKQSGAQSSVLNNTYSCQEDLISILQSNCYNFNLSYILLDLVESGFMAKLPQGRIE